MSVPTIWPIFNPKDFQATTFIDSIISNSILSQNVSAAVSTVNGENLATEPYVDSMVTNLQNTLLGTNIPSQLNQNLDTILEIDNFITGLQTTVNTKANQSDLDITNTNVTTNTNNINTINGQITTINNTLNTKANQTSLDTTNSRVTSLEGKTNSLSYNSATNTTTINSKLQVNLDTGNVGNTYIGDSSTDALIVNATTTFNGSVSGLTKSTVGLSNVDNTSDVNKPLSTAQKSYVDTGLALKANQTNLDTTNTNVTNLTTRVGSTESNITSLQSSKADRTNTLYNNSWYVNGGTNPITSVLSSIGTAQNQTIYLCSGGITESSGLILSKINLSLTGPDSAFASPQTTVYGATTISGSTTLRTRISNVQFNDLFTIDGTVGKHSFKGVTFNNGFTVSGATSDFILCYYCSFSGPVTIPNTFGSFIIFYFCDFSGASLTLNNVSNQQVYFNSCVNLPTLSVNGILNGFNQTVSSSAINSVTLNVSGATSFPAGSIASTSINNTSFVDLSGNQIISGTKTINNLITVTQTAKDNSTKVASTAYVDSAVANLVSSAPSTLDTLNELASALGNDPSFSATVTNLIGTKASQSSLDTTNTNVTNLTTRVETAETNISGLQSSKQNTLTFDSTPTSASTNPVTSGGIYTALQNYATTSALSSGLSGKQNSLTFDSSPTSASTNPVTSGGIYTALQSYQPTSGMSSYLTTANASSTYQTQTGMSNYLTTSNASSTYAPINNASLTGVTTVNEVSEGVYNAGSGTNLSLTYTSVKGIVYYTPSANFTLTLSSVPTTSTNASYTLTFIYNAKFYCSAISVNGTSRTMISGGGLTNISVNSSATYVMQQITIAFLNSSIPTVITNVLSLF